MLSINFIGTGKLGKIIGKLIAINKVANIQSIYNRSKKHSIDAISFIGMGLYCKSITNVLPADITFITTTDREIKNIYIQLHKNKLLKKNSIILHCSGSLTSDIFFKYKHINYFTASIHPMKSFSSTNIRKYIGTHCTIEGDKQALNIMIPILKKIGFIVYIINKRKKYFSHIASIFVSNYLLGIANQSLILFKKTKITNTINIKKIIIDIMENTINNIKENNLSLTKSLTGPIRRIDMNIIKKHQLYLNKEQKELYCQLGKSILILTNHSKKVRNKILNILHTK